MDAIEPILPGPPILPGVGAAQRPAPVRRDGHQGEQAPGQQRRRGEEEAVEVDVEVEGDVEAGVEADVEGTHRIDLRA